jgi:hypothetical protein
MLFGAITILMIALQTYVALVAVGRPWIIPFTRFTG